MSLSKPKHVKTLGVITPTGLIRDLFSGKKKHSESETIRNFVRAIPNHLAPLPGSAVNTGSRQRADQVRYVMFALAFFNGWSHFGIWDVWKAMLNRTRFLSSATSLLGFGVLDAATKATVWLDSLVLFFQRWSLLREVRDHAANGLTMLGWSQKDLGPGIWSDESVAFVQPCYHSG